MMPITFILSLLALSSVAFAAAEEPYELATFAGGCFWCTESDFEKVPGVLEVVSGYTGGSVDNPSYEQVSSGSTGHAEAVQIKFDPSVVTYQELLHIYWRSIDPTTPNRQFCDVGNQYRTEIFTHSGEQQKQAEASLKELEQSGRFDVIATKISPFQAFYPAEEYHQNYYKKNPVRYEFYRWNCGRDARLEEIWGEE